MSTHAILAVEHDNIIYAKYVQYGLYSDYRHDLNHASYEEYLLSVMGGASSEPFDGFYLNAEHTIREMNWPVSTHFDYMKIAIPKAFKTMSKLFDYAKNECADYIYLMKEDGTRLFFEYEDGQYRHMQTIFDLQPYDISTFEGISFEDLRREMFDAIDFEDYVDDPFTDIKINEILKKYHVTEDDLNKVDNIDDLKIFAFNYNAALAAIKEAL